MANWALISIFICNFCKSYCGTSTNAHINSSCNMQEEHGGKVNGTSIDEVSILQVSIFQFDRPMESFGKLQSTDDFHNDAKPLQLHWSKNSLRLVYDAEKAVGKHRFVHSPTIINHGDGIDHIFACHNREEYHFDDYIYTGQVRENEELKEMQLFYGGIRQSKNYSINWGDPLNYYWNACEPAVLVKQLTYMGQKFDHVMLHTTMPMQSFYCNEYVYGKKRACTQSLPNCNCDDDSDYNDIGVAFFWGGDAEAVPLHEKPLTYNKTRRGQAHAFEYGIGQPSIVTFSNDEHYVFYTYGDSVDGNSRWNILFSRLTFDEVGLPHFEQTRTLNKSGIQDVFGNQVTDLSNIDVIYDQYRDKVYMLTDMYPFPLNARVSGAQQILHISRRGLFDESEPWQQLGVIWEDQLYAQRQLLDYGFNLKEYSQRHNAFHTHLKRNHNGAFVKSGQGTLVERDRLRIYITSANNLPAWVCIESMASICAEYSYKLYVLEGALDGDENSGDSVEVH